MLKEFKLPDLGEGVHEGEVMSIPVSVGDTVSEGDTILEVETDKAAVEIPSPYDATIKDIKVEVGDVVNVGDVMMTFDVEGEAGEEKQPSDKESAEAGKPKKPEGEEESPEPEQDKAEAQKAEKSKAEKPEADKTGRSESSGESEKRKGGPVPASPATRRLAREMGVDLHDVTPTGRGGVVTSDDVRDFAEGKKAEPEAEAKPEKAAEEKEKKRAAPEEHGREEARPLTAEAPELPDFTKWGEVERKPVRSVRRAIAKQMAVSWSRIPHVTTQDEVDITDLEAFRQKHKAEIKEQGGKLTPTVFVVKALVTALKQHPRFNASLDERAGEIVLKRYYNIGIAVDTDDGLIVPVLRDVDRKSLTEIAVEMNELIRKTRDRKTSLEELQGASFTVTNIGGLRGDHFMPIINHPQVAIFGMGRAKLKPVVREKVSGKPEIVPRLMMPIVLANDHRVLDGADAARFIDVVATALEDPERLMLTMS